MPDACLSMLTFSFATLAHTVCWNNFVGFDALGIGLINFSNGRCTEQSDNWCAQMFIFSQTVLMHTAYTRIADAMFSKLMYAS